MKQYQGHTLSWELRDGVIEMALHREPLNEIGSQTLEELEKFVAVLDALSHEAHALIIYSTLKGGFCAGADLRQLYGWFEEFGQSEVARHAREYLQRIHAVMNALDAAPLTTIAAVLGVTFGGGFELALTCDLIIADKMARFSFPELRLGLIPGFGGIPRLKRDLGNGVVRDLLLTGRSFNAAKAQAVGLVAQLAAEGQALKVARATAAQVTKFDATTRAAAKKFIKPVPHEELRREIEVFCELFTRSAVMAGLRKFVENTGPMPYQP